MLDDRAWLARVVDAMLHEVAPQASAATAASSGLGMQDHAAPIPPSVSQTSIHVAPVMPAASGLALLLTPSLLHRLGVRDANGWVRPLIAACAAQNIDTPRRIAAFLANILVESKRLSALVEDLNYSPQGLMKTWPHRFDQANAQALGFSKTRPANQRGIAEIAYGGRFGNAPSGGGDGYFFRGRGLIQITFRSNYARFGEVIGVSAEALPPRLESREQAAASATEFWHAKGCNRLADGGDIDDVRTAVNGGSNGLTEVRAAYKQACALLAVH